MKFRLNYHNIPEDWLGITPSTKQMFWESYYDEADKFIWFFLSPNEIWYLSKLFSIFLNFLNI